MPQSPAPAGAGRRGQVRTALLLSGLIDLALAGFFLGWGGSLLGLEDRVAWLIAAALAAAGVVTLFVAALALGRIGKARALDPGEARDEPVVRRDRQR